MSMAPNQKPTSRMCMATGWIILFAVIIISLCDAGRVQRAWPKELDDDPPPEKRETYDLPKDISWIHDGDIFRLRKSVDVLVILVIQPFLCPQCKAGHTALIKAHSNLVNDESGHVDRLLRGKALSSALRFGVLDAEDEAPEFISQFHDVDEENYRQKVPCVLIYKQYHQDVLKKPPVLFTYTEGNLKKNFLPFIVRLVGEDIPVVDDEAALMTRVASRFTNRVSIAIWGSDGATASAVSVEASVAIESRFDVFWSRVASPEAQELLAPKFNPLRYDVVAYFYKGKFGEVALPEVLPEGQQPDDILEIRGFRRADVVGNEELRPQRRDDKIRRALRNLLDEVMVLRPGQEFDKIRKATIIEDFIPEGCNNGEKGYDTRASSSGRHTRASRIGDKILVRVIGTLVATGDEFADTFEEVLTVGMSRGDFPDVLLREGLEGLCPGSKRRFAFPALQAYPEDSLPPGVAKEAKIVFSIHMIRFAEEQDAVSGLQKDNATVYPGGSTLLSPDLPPEPPEDL